MMDLRKSYSNEPIQYISNRFLSYQPKYMRTLTIVWRIYLLVTCRLNIIELFYYALHLNLARQHHSQMYQP
jgi:hypothetical protein